MWQVIATADLEYSRDVVVEDRMLTCRGNGDDDMGDTGLLHVVRFPDGRLVVRTNLLLLRANLRRESYVRCYVVPSDSRELKRSAFVLLSHRAGKGHYLLEFILPTFGAEIALTQAENFSFPTCGATGGGTRSKTPPPPRIVSLDHWWTQGKRVVLPRTQHQERCTVVGNPKRLRRLLAKLRRKHVDGGGAMFAGLCREGVFERLYSPHLVDWDTMAEQAAIHFLPAGVVVPPPDDDAMYRSELMDATNSAVNATLSRWRVAVAARVYQLLGLAPSISGIDDARPVLVVPNDPPAAAATVPLHLWWGEPSGTTNYSRVDPGNFWFNDLLRNMSHDVNVQPFRVSDYVDLDDADIEEVW